MCNLTLKKIDAVDFEHIYNDMLLQFPKAELKPYNKFLNLIKKNVLKCDAVFDEQTEIGYIIYALLENNAIWLDYIAVKKDFHSKGYGKRIFKLIPDCYLEVEKPDIKNPDSIRRIKFYQYLGAVKLNINYIYPNTEGGLPMDLYYLGNTLPDNNTVYKTIKFIFKNLHTDINNIIEILNDIKFV